MNKSELIDAISEEADITKTDASKTIDAIGDGIIAALTDGDTVTIAGFGTFSLTSRTARTGRNPRTGATISIEAHKTPRFKVAKLFINRLNED